MANTYNRAQSKCLVLEECKKKNKRGINYLAKLHIANISKILTYLPTYLSTFHKITMPTIKQYFIFSLLHMPYIYFLRSHEC